MVMPDNRKNQRDDNKNKQQQGQKKRDGGTNVGNDNDDRDEDQIITQRNPRMDDQNKDNSDSDVE
jgi:hypothetical protein